MNFKIYFMFMFYVELFGYINTVNNNVSRKRSADNVKGSGSLTTVSYALRTHLQTVASSKCGPGLVLNDGICINVTECTKPVLNNGECLNKCPDGFIFVPTELNPRFSFGENQTIEYHYTAKDINWNPCVRRTTVVAITICITILTAGYCIFVWMFLCSPDCLTELKILISFRRRMSGTYRNLLKSTPNQHDSR